MSAFLFVAGGVLFVAGGIFLFAQNLPLALVGFGFSCTVLGLAAVVLLLERQRN
jgi:hypothetical protein